MCALPEPIPMICGPRLFDMVQVLRCVDVPAGFQPQQALYIVRKTRSRTIILARDYHALHTSS